MKATEMLRQHIADLLMTRKEDQKELARYCGKDKSWINKILKGHRNLMIEDLDRIADFFGIATYQLLQPGISPISERRAHLDRRAGQDRRIGHQQRELRTLSQHMSDMHGTRGQSSKRRA